jgi:hypothetical protein
MNLAVAIAVVVAATVVAIGAMLVVRRTAPDGGYFHDGDRAAGVFGVLATGFAVLLGFVVFLAFTSYDAARAGAEAEALTVAQQIETAQFLPAPVVDELTGELVCYARSVAGVQWERMESGALGEQVNPWAVELFRTLRTVEPQTAAEQSAYDAWLDQTSNREEARNDRIHGAVGVIPAPLWVVLFFSAGLIFVFMLFFADSGERAPVQALLIGVVATTRRSRATPAGTRGRSGLRLPGAAPAGHDRRGDHCIHPGRVMTAHPPPRDDDTIDKEKDHGERDSSRADHGDDRGGRVL